MIRYVHVKKAFGSKRIYEDLHFDVLSGETLTILGGSGQGKSVMIKILIGLLTADEGQVLYRGVDLTKVSEFDLIEVRKRISMVFQLAALFDSLTVFENIAYPLREHLRLSEDEIRHKVEAQLELINLPRSFATRYPSELSGGMRKLVGLARSIVMEPEVILYDEPTTGLDPESTVRVNKLIRTVQEERGVSAMVITHDMGGAFYFSDRIAFLYGRRIHRIGSVQEMRNADDEILQKFLRGIPDEEE
ncbi:MAG: ATP-binding cassette domain-containing protein [Myxococcales bacterium]|nr:ATP-binding cassette domain-containing protein [Myxococcales bacterium]